MTTKFLVELVNMMAKKYMTRDPFEICKYEQIYISMKKMSKNVKPISFTEGNVKVVILNQDMSHRDNVNILAHELGHHILGHDIGLDEYGSYKVHSLSQDKEFEADSFAAALLLPDETISDYVRLYHYTPKEIASLSGVYEKYVEIKIAQMFKLGYKFECDSFD